MTLAIFVSLVFLNENQAEALEGSPEAKPDPGGLSDSAFGNVLALRRNLILCVMELVGPLGFEPRTNGL